MGIAECVARTRSNSPAFAAQWLAEGSDSLRCHRARGLLSRRAVGLRRVGSVKDTGTGIFSRSGAPDCVSTERMPVSQVARSIPRRSACPRGFDRLASCSCASTRPERSGMRHTTQREPADGPRGGKNTTGPLHRAGAGQTGRPDVRSSRGDPAKARLPQWAPAGARARSQSQPADRDLTHDATCPESRGAQLKQPFEAGRDKSARPEGEPR